MKHFLLVQVNNLKTSNVKLTITLVFLIDVITAPGPSVHDIFAQSHYSSGTSAEAQCVEQYIRYLRSQYNSRPFPTYFKAPLINFRAKHFINLALVDSSLDAEEHQRTSILMQISGHVDEIQRKKKKIRIDDIGRLADGSIANYILIEGAPGIGKTTFAWELCSQWANRLLLQQWSLLILIQMRDKRVREAKTLADLLYHPESFVSNSVCQTLNNVDGKNVLLFFEGYDEISHSQLEDECIFQKLLRKEVLPYAGIIVSSRPIATKSLCEHFLGQIQQHIQIVGFTSDDITAYITSACSENPRLKNEFESYLSLHPFVYSIMYVPLYCSIIAELYSVHWNKGTMKFAPKTLTDVYNALVMHLLQRQLELQHPLHVWNLPVDIQGRLMDLGRVALEGIYKQQYIYDYLKCDHMGLMQIIRDFYMKSSVVSYSFLHQTLQEYLAAFYVTQGTPKEVTQILSNSEHFPIQKYLQGEHRKQSNTMFHWPVLLFISGLSKLDGFPIDVFKSVLRSNQWDPKVKQFHPALLQLLFETQSQQLISAVFSKGKYLALPWEMTPLDWFVLGYCISKSSPLSEWKIEYEMDHIDTLQSLEFLAKGVHYHSSLDKSGGVIRTISLSGANKLHQCIEAVCELREYALDVAEITLGGDMSPGTHAAKVLQQLVLTCPRLVRLQLSSHSSFASWYALFERFSDLKALERLELEACFTRQDAELLIVNLKKCISLKHLMIWFNEGSEESYSCLVTGIAPLAIDKLLTLSIQRFAIDSEIAVSLANSIASTNCSLTYYDMTETSVSANDYEVIIDAVVKNTSLETFQWQECDIYGHLHMKKSNDHDVHSNLRKIVLSSESMFEGCQPLFNKLAKLKFLENLKLSGDFSKLDAGSLCEQLQCCQQLKELSFIFMGESNTRGELVKGISHLISFSVLKQLTLGYCHFNSEMARELSSSLSSSESSLNALKLTGSKIASRDFSMIAEALSQNNSLKSLKIENSGLNNEAMICLATALVAHPCIEDIEISEKNMSEQTKALVKELIETNPNVKNLKLSGRQEELDFFKRLEELGYI